MVWMLSVLSCQKGVLYMTEQLQATVDYVGAD
jgi:hypothetical protein